MTDKPLMPKATAVWLVENTSLTFEQIADFCGLHVLEVKGIADGDVAHGIRGSDPMTSGSSPARKSARAKRSVLPAEAGAFESVHPRDALEAGAEIHARLAPPRPSERHIVALASSCRAARHANHASCRNDEDDHRIHPRAHPLERGKFSAAGPCRAWVVLANRPRFRGAKGGETHGGGASRGSRAPASRCSRSPSSPISTSRSGNSRARRLAAGRTAPGKGARCLCGVAKWRIFRNFGRAKAASGS